VRELKRRTSILSSFAGLANAICQFALAEKAYIFYVRIIESNYGINSIEASNCFFLIGGFYLENNYLKKAMACFRKCLDVRVRELKGLKHSSSAAQGYTMRKNESIFEKNTERFEK
jgi:hypothetical protein